MSELKVGDKCVYLKSLFKIVAIHENLAWIRGLNIYGIGFVTWMANLEPYTPKPQPCPACGKGTDICTHMGVQKYFVRCEDAEECGLIGPNGIDEVAAIELWNRIRMEKVEPLRMSGRE